VSLRENLFEWFEVVRVVRFGSMPRWGVENRSIRCDIVWRGRCGVMVRTNDRSRRVSEWF
jgi:hypothetical protein